MILKKDIHFIWISFFNINTLSDSTFFNQTLLFRLKNFFKMVVIIKAWKLPELLT